MVHTTSLPKAKIDKDRIRAILRSDYFILFLIALIYVIIISSVAIVRHNAFRTNAWDLSIYAQSLYTTLNHGKLLYYTCELPGNPAGSLFGIHFSPFLFLLLPIYALFQNPITLLVLRPVAISLGLIPLYWILREQHPNRKLLIFFIAIIYVIYPPITAPVSNFDVEVFLPALFLFAMYYLKKGKLLNAYAFVVLALMVNEFVPLIILSMALYFFLLHRTNIIGGLLSKKVSKNAIFVIILLATSIVWFMSSSAIISHFNPNALSTKWEWGEFGNSPGEIVINVVTNPGKTITALLNDGQSKFLYITSLFGPLMFLSFLNPLTLIMTLPWLGASLLSINPLYYAIGTQYPAFVSPFIFVAAINGIKKLGEIGNKNVIKKIGYLMAVTLAISILLFPAAGDFVGRSSDDVTRMALKEIPSTASVSVMPDVHPHLCNRLEVYPYFQQGVDYVLLDVYNWWYDVVLPRPAHVAPRWCDAEIGDEYGIVINAKGVLLYQNGYTGPVKIFEGVDFTYKHSDVQIATGKVVQDDVNLEGSIIKTDVLVHNATTDPTPLFFTVPEKVMPPGTYNVTVLLKTSNRTRSEVITLTALKAPEQSTVATKTIRGNDFKRAETWQMFMLSFTLEQPTYIKIVAEVTHSTDVSFYSMNVLQTMGGG
ncbi:DUF2079 domain-containing protein [Candidatus Bathyarchaeota archaeon]|nr:DUF2079 domain-containing protein [Candidatus Bathyarchaeota archaeon]